MILLGFIPGDSVSSVTDMAFDDDGLLGDMNSPQCEETATYNRIKKDGLLI